MSKRRRHSPSSSPTSSTSSSSSSSSSSSCSITLHHSNPDHLFPITLAAAISNNPTTSQQILQKALDHILLSLLSKSHSLLDQQFLHAPLVSLLPVILSSKCSEIVCSGLEIVGAASLFSIEMNEQIALDEDTVKRLINAVGSCNKSVSMAACNAILDLFTTSIGRFKLLELSAINNLMSQNLQHLQSL